MINPQIRFEATWLVVKNIYRIMESQLPQQEIADDFSIFCRSTSKYIPILRETATSKFLDSFAYMKKKIQIRLLTRLLTICLFISFPIKIHNKCKFIHSNSFTLSNTLLSNQDVLIAFNVMKLHDSILFLLLASKKY